MKQFFGMLAVIVLSALLSCKSSTGNPPKVVEVCLIADTGQISKDTLSQIKLKDGAICTIACFVKLKGQPMGRGQYQYVFTDSNMNRHEIIFNGGADLRVWSYYKGIKDFKSFFGWYISQRNEVYGIEGSSHMSAIKQGYNELLALAKKESLKDSQLH